MERRSRRRGKTGSRGMRQSGGATCPSRFRAQAEAANGREKLRLRGMRTTWFAGALVLTSVAVVVAAEPSVEAARKALEAEMAGYRQAGEPAVVADLQAPVVPDAQNGVLQLRQAAKAIDGDSEAYRQADLLNLDGKLTAEQQLALRTACAESAEMLALVEEGLAKGRFDWQVKMESPLINVRLPDLAQQRAVANTLQMAVMAAHFEGEDELALGRIEQMLAIGNAVEGQPFLVSHLVACGINSLAAANATRIAPELDAAAGTPARKRVESLIAALLEESAARKGLRHAILSERVSKADMAMAIAEGRIKAEELLKWTGLDGANRPVLPRTDAVAQAIALEDALTGVRYCTQVVAAVGEANWPAAKARFPERPTIAPDRYFLRTMLSSYDRAIPSHFRVLMMRRMAAVALAARCYALDNGKAPAALAELCPKYLPQVPGDLFTGGEALRYVAEKGIVYSVGVDGKDDGGRQEEGKMEPDVVVKLRP